MPKIINMGIVAHVDAGKTTITEQLLYRAGSVRTIGSVDDGTSQTDWLEIERSRGISVKASSARFTVGDTTVNIIDTPGHVDFSGEVERSLQILDCAVLVISAVEGIQAQTEVLLEALRTMHTNTVIVINKIDRAGSHFDEIVAELEKNYEEPLLVCTSPEREENRDCGILCKDLFAEENREEIILRLAEQDEALLERYLSGETIEKKELEQKFSDQINRRQIVPVLAASGITGVGIEALLQFIVNYLAPVKADQDEELSGVIYKITHDKTFGKIAHVRLFSGELHPRDSILVHEEEGAQKITQLKQYFGAKSSDLSVLTAGDIGGICGIPSLQIGDVIGKRHHSTPYQLAVPLLKVQVLPQSPEQIYDLKSALEELSGEDPLLEFEFINQTKEMHIKITGTIQLEILEALLLERFGLRVTFSAPSVIYKETPTKEAIGFESYTAPKPCWAIVKLLIQPGEKGSGYEYHSEVPNNQIFYRYQHHIETSVKDTLKQGNYNWEVCDLKVTLIGGNHHTIHTHPLDFFLATPIAVMDGLKNAGTTLLEPIITMKISAEEEFLGKVLGDIIAMRGEFDSPVIQKGNFTLEAKVPVATSMDYSVKLAAMTSGKAFLSTKFLGYQECPIELGAIAPRYGTHPLDRAKWILEHRSAIS